MTHPEPFDVDEEAFLAGPDPRALDIDDVFAKPFARMLGEMRRDAPDEVEMQEGDTGLPSLLVPGVTFVEVPCGIMALDPGGTPIGGYLSCDVGVDEAWQGRGLGAELIIELALRQGEVPTWNLDNASYSRAGEAAHRAAWRHARSHPGETALRVERLRAAGYSLPMADES